jgi:hypothetical protein
MTEIRLYQSFRKSEGYVFPVTADVVTAASCKHGDYQHCGYCDNLGRWEDERTLWCLADLLSDLPDSYSPVESDCSHGIPRWVTIDAGPTWWDEAICRELASDFEDVLSVTLSVHRPPMLTDSSWLRVCRMLGWRPKLTTTEALK